MSHNWMASIKFGEHVGKYKIIMQIHVFWDIKSCRWVNLSRPVEGITIPRTVGNCLPNPQQQLIQNFKEIRRPRESFSLRFCLVTWARISQSV